MVFIIIYLSNSQQIQLCDVFPLYNITISKIFTSFSQIQDILLKLPVEETQFRCSRSNLGRYPSVFQRFNKSHTMSDFQFDPPTTNRNRIKLFPLLRMNEVENMLKKTQLLENIIPQLCSKFWFNIYGLSCHRWNIYFNQRQHFT